VTCEACGITPFDVMTGCTTLDIASRLLGMEAAAAPRAKRSEPRQTVAGRLEPRLVDVATRTVALRAERLHFMARLAFHPPGLCIDAVREAVVQLVHVLQSHLVR